MIKSETIWQAWKETNKSSPWKVYGLVTLQAVTVKSLRPCDSADGLVALGTYFQLEAGLNKVADEFAWHSWRDITEDHEQDTHYQMIHLLIILKKNYGIQSYSLRSSLTVRNWV